MNQRFFWLVFLIVAIAGAYYYYSKGGPQGQHGMEGMAMPVSVAKVIARDAVEWDEFSGRLMAADRVEIRPRVGGTIDQIFFKEGEQVKKGQKLFLIDPKPYQAAVKAAKAKADYAQDELRRARQLLPEKAISQREFDEKKNAAEVAAAELTRAELDLGYTTITSPIEGRVGRAEITEGNLIEGGSSAPMLTLLVDDDPIYADFDVDEATFVRYVQAHGTAAEALKGIPVELGLSGQGDYAYRGHVKSFDNELDTRAGSVRARAVFDNPDGKLISGLFARVRVGGSGEHRTLLIHDQAIGTDQNRKFVYVVGPDNVAQNRVITLGPRVDNLRAVTDGLKEGETIVVNGLQRVRPGAPVMPQMVPMDKPDAATPPPGGVPGAGGEEKAK